MGDQSAMVATSSVGDPERLLESVELQERLESQVPKGIKIAAIGVPVVWDILGSGFGFSTLLIGFCGYLAARFLTWLTRTLYLNPLHIRRFDRIAEFLKRRLAESGFLTLGPYSWTLYAPGALAADSKGTLLVAARPTRYETLSIPPSSIVDVQVRRTSEIVTDTRHSGNTIIGGASGGLGMAFASGSNSRSVTRELQEFFLEIRFQLERNGSVRTIVVPGGSDHRTVEELCFAIRRLQGD